VSRTEARSRSVLLVDDEETVLAAMKDYFTAHDYDVDCATEMEEAEALIEHRKYGVLICDLRLNGTRASEGLDIIGMMRQSSRDTRIVLLTGHGSSDLAREAASHGAHLFLEKPIELSRLRELIEALTGRED